MTKIALIYGGLAGAIVISIITAGWALAGMDSIFASQWLGYLLMLAALSFVFVGVKRHRDVERGGVIKFWRGLGLGVAIAAVAGVVYVAGWEIYLAATDHAFVAEYVDSVISDRAAAGASEEELAEFTAQMDAFAEQYANPFFRLPITFLEIFPVGLLVAIVSAAILRNPNVLPMRR